MTSNILLTSSDLQNVYIYCTCVLISNFVISDPIVRSELMEQIPHIAVYCHDNIDIFQHAVPMYILPMVVRYLDDANNQVIHILSVANNLDIIRFQSMSMDINALFIGLLIFS